MNQNQGRTFGPLLGLFLVNLLAKLVTAKYYSYLPYHFSYDPSPWLAYNKPLPSHNHHSSYSQWYPIKNPYEHLYQAYPTLTTASPYLTGEHQVDYDYREEYEYPINAQYANYDRLIPAESNNIQKQVTQYKRTIIPHKKEQEDIPLKSPTTISPVIIDKPETTTTVTTTVVPTLTTTTARTLEPVAAESSFKVRRQPTQKYKRRSPSRRDKYPQRRRRTTTPAPEYYDSYEDDYTERYQPNRKRRPPYQQSSESYYDANNEEYYDYETTTRYYKKQKRRPTRKVNRNQNQNRNDDSFEIETSTERFNPNTEIVIVRQAMPTTTAASTTTNGGSTTTEPTTIITNTTSSSTTTASTNNTYGYGPSNGNEHVSFTYGPPVGPYSHYQVPYVDWYAHEATKNAIVKRVRDIVNIDERLNLK
ncbi:hypothetical protein Zmor_002783 [Zophobas morio]|uniref:Uncharacterized protein n=2 Tax=Zophobas morio TaxID=2755281 RepID=A0AA38HMZ2_9CUCU|nr:hypothetical protein Zmor_002783 [Zophobas morio]